MNREEIEKLAESAWEGCHHCDENDKYFWINGFIIGYMQARIEYLDKQTESNQKKIANLLINGKTNEL
jgi:hypothetical protein